MLKTTDVCFFRIKNDVGLTPGSNLTPKQPSIDPFMTDEQRKRVSEAKFVLVTSLLKLLLLLNY